MSTDIVLAVEASPLIVLTDAKTYSSFYDAMKAEVEAFVPDLTTVSGRKAIASLARKVATTKVAKEAADREAKQRAADAEAKRLAEEQAARDKDRAHRGKVMGETKAYLIELGVDESLAKTIVLAIVANSVPHVSLRF